jgi:serine/threonine protein kinase
MRLSPGDQLGPYEILALIGKGGMGEVYRARDSRLHRDVAIKVLPRDKVADPQRTRRFLQEARAASALSHPNIVTLHDIANVNGTDYLIMEYVPGKSLDMLITPKGLPLAEVLNYAQQIAGGLAAAHAAGIVHRDMKPGNVIVTSESQVKILDFGLAKLVERAPSAEGETQTQEAPLTEAGTVLGTVAYMSPEQASARPLDHRADIFSLGVMLYEMLAGTRPFRGNSRVETMHAIIHDPAPPLASVPPRLEEVLEKALEKDPRDRYQHAGDLALDLRRVERNAGAKSAAQIVASPPTKSRAWISWAITAIAVASLLGVLLWPRRGAPGREPIRFTFEPPDHTTLVRSHLDTVLSPDGRRIALVLKDASGTNAIWVRPLDAQESRKIDGTDDASNIFWSPDGQFLGFFAQGKLKKIALAGGPPQNICTTAPGIGAAWSPAGEIVFNPSNRAPLMHVSAAGGKPQRLTALDSGRQENSHRYPSFLPDGRHFLFTARSSLKENTAIYVGSLDSREIKRILTEQSNAVYVPPGYILFARDGSLLAERFDAARLELSGEAFPVAGNVDQETPSATAFFTASADGSVIAYSEASHSTDQLTWFDHGGTNLGTLGPKGHYTTPRFSPDGKRLAVTIPDPESGNRDIWILELASGSLTRFTTNPANDWVAAWSPDGKYLAFASDRTPRSSIYRKAADGSGEEELLVPAGDTMGAFTDDWSHNGRLLAYHMDMTDTIDLWLLPLLGDGKPRPFLKTRFREFGMKFSPDSKTVAYVSNDSGAFEVYVAPIDKPGKQRVSSGGGNQPHWRPDGKELYYLSHESLMAAEVKGSGESVTFGTPGALFQVCQYSSSGSGNPDYDISPDGKRFLFPCRSVDASRRSVSVVIGWLDMVKYPGRQGEH